MTALTLLQQRQRILSELSRRIGYTNGLHDIYRFSRVVSYLHAIEPASTADLRSMIIERESVKGSKYADGVIDVTKALGLVHKSGMNRTLSDIGYALHAIQQIPPSQESVKALLMHSVLVFDGDATVNLLDIIDKPEPSDSIGKLLIERLLRILALRTDFAESNIESKFIRDIVLKELYEAKRRLVSAVDIKYKQGQSWSSLTKSKTLTAEQRVKRFYSHTVTPRRGWLKDFGCIQECGRHQFVVTNSGHRILNSLKEASCYTNSLILLPYSAELCELLGMSSLDLTKDLYWRATASSFGEPSTFNHLSPDDLFQFVVAIYPHIKFHLFNEAAIDSLHAAWAARLATNAQYINRDNFNKILDEMIIKYSNRLHRMRQRHGGTGYISLRG